MKETNSRGKAHVVPVAVVAGVGMAGMGLVSNGVVVADTTSATDTINVTVQPSCTFNSVEDKTYAGSATNGTEVNNFNESGIHEFNLFCNDHNGFVVSATAYDLTATGVQDVIAYTNNYTHTGVNSMWTAEIASDTPGVTVVNQFVPMGGGTIISSDSHTTVSGADFTASYSAYVGTETPAGTYTGTIVYTLTAAGTSNSNSGNNGGSGSGGTEQNDNNGENGGDNGGTNSGNEVTDNTDNNGGSGGSGTGTDNSGTGGSGTGDANSGNSNPDANSGNPANNAPSNAPLAMSNTYNTYNTTNSYSTTNYSGGAASTPAVAGTQGATSGTTSGTTSGDDDSTTGSGNDNSGNSGANSNYEKPLGVVSTTLSDNSSDFDPMPIVVTGTALGVAGIAAIAVAQKKKKEEEE